MKYEIIVNCEEGPCQYRVVEWYVKEHGPAVVVFEHLIDAENWIEDHSA